MKGSNIIAVSVVAAVVLWLRSRKQLFDSTMFTLAGVKIAGNVLQPELTILLKAINNSTHSQMINGIEGNILLNDTVIIGNVLQTKKQEIAPMGESIIELPVNVRLSGVIDTVANLITRRTGKYSFVGTVNVYGVRVPVNQSHTL